MKRDFVGLIGARGAKLIVGLATMFVYARMFGVSATYDAWIWSLGIVNAIGMMLFGPITETIRASYAATEHREGRESAEQYLATIGIMMIGTATVMTIVASVLLPMVATDPNGDRTVHAQASTDFLRIMAPSLILSQMVTVLTAHLNCQGRVYPPEIAGIVGGGAGVLFITLFPHLPAVWLLPGSYYIGLAAPLLIRASFWIDLARSAALLDRAVFRRHARGAMAFSLPLLLPYALGQASGLIERQYALWAGTGVLGVLSYALFARNTIQAVFTAALSAMAVPTLARAWSPDDRSAFREVARQWIHQCLLLLTLGSIVLFGLSDLLTALLFGNKIALSAQCMLGEMLRYYAVAMISVILYLLGGSMLLAAHKGKTYSILGAVASVLSILLLVAGFPVIGILAIPVALGISHAVAAWMMFNTVDRADGSAVVGQAAVRAAVIVAAGSLIRLIDRAALVHLGYLSGRIALSLGMAGLLCGAWWWFDRSGPRRAVAIG
ncbi:putative peptidoglycan lipid II flippase [Sphingomonas sp. BE138]|uniref:lipid II flippase MurJ n=1 Tax=Sphingomonas sp. BE138 TaxID=2817845 RepID=UPI0028573348|nr:lipid II flippase MurJ [Sphingomonas sp. BE138]MDR6789720.1 putative peptidoglycan lipid II flippase [Sphingomonas sp. BE138]